MTESDSSLYDIIFRGDIMPGQQLPQVKAKLAQLFKTDEQKINALFAGAAVPLKKNLDKASAEKYQAVLRQAGADVQIAPAGKVTAKPVRVRPAPSVPSQGQKNRGEPSAKAMSMQERLAKQQAENAKAEMAVEEASKSESTFTLAPVGADLLVSSEKAAEPKVNIDVSQLQLRPQEGNLVDSAELERDVPVVVELRDYGLSELGDDLVSDDERETVEMAVVNVLDVEVAPPGSELGQIQKAAPPPPPDTSAITLE